MAEATAQVVNQKGREIIVVDGFNFIKEVVDKMVAGDLGTCPFSDKPKGIYQWICSDSFSRAEEEERGKGHDIAKAAKKALVQAGGVIVQPQKQPQKPRINNELFHEIVNVGIGQLAEDSKVTVEQIHRRLIVLYPKEDQTILGKAAAIANGIVKKRLAENERHQQEWQDAQRAVELYYKRNPNDFFHQIAEIVDEIFLDKTIKVEASYGKLTKAVADKQNNLLWEICTRETKNYFTAHPKDLRHPTKIAKEIIKARTAQKKCGPPDWMLARAVHEKQEVLREEERQRNIASANKFTENRKVKKPGSAARRGQGLNGPRLKKAGAKKRCVKG